MISEIKEYTYLIELDNYEDIKRIKYNLLFLDIHTSNRYLKQQKANIKNCPSRELYKYFVNYFREKYFYDTLNFFKNFNDEWFLEQSELIDFELSLIELKTYMNNLDNEIIEEEYEYLLKNEAPNKSVEYVKQYLELQMREKSNKKGKIKR